MKEVWKDVPDFEGVYLSVVQKAVQCVFANA